MDGLKKNERIMINQNVAQKQNIHMMNIVIIIHKLIQDVQLQ